jgi:hypothetical protein
MKPTITLILLLLLSGIKTNAQNIPEGYLLQYQQNFSDGKALADFKVENPDKWGIFKNKTNLFLQCSSADSITDLPLNIAVLINRFFGDFILEADVMPGNDTDAVKDICLFLGLRNPSKYYFVQLSNLDDSSHNGIFLVKNSTSRRLTDDAVRQVTWNTDKWHHVRLERNIIRRTIVIYFDNMTLPFMQVKDYELVMGSVGFGSFTGSARIDNIKIWAPTVLTGEELKAME